MMPEVREGLLRRARLTRDLPAFLRTPLPPERAVELVKAGLETRAARLLELVEWTIYANPRSPYLRLLEMAGCQAGDLRALVAAEGIEGALTRLARDGVYVTFDELKGRREIVRGSERFAVTETDFDNPLIRPHFEFRTGGTGGPASAIKLHLGFATELATGMALSLEAQGISDAEHVVWTSGAVTVLRSAKLGRPPVAWYSSLQPLPPGVRLGAWYFSALGRLAGCPLPWLTSLELQEPERLVRWLAGRLRSGRPICVFTRPSSAVRVATAAQEWRTSLGGVWFMLSGEPCSETQRRLIEASGARLVVRYSFFEAGTVACGCAEPQVADDVHLLGHIYALIQRSRAVEGTDLPVQAYLFTTFYPAASKILLNAESGDYGLLEERACGCLLGRIGLRQHLSQIRSFEKLTSEGMTFVHTQLQRVLEEVLPSRFGGTVADYQVVEREGPDGVRRLHLLAHPRLGVLDPDELRRSFLEQLGQPSAMEGYMARYWERAGTVVIERQPPIATKAGKVFPFHLVREKSATDEAAAVSGGHHPALEQR
jgi:hypothetical protein